MRIEDSTATEIVWANAMSGLSGRSMMITTNRYNDQFRGGNDGLSPDSANTLVPMLVGGLGLIVVGMIAVGIFVG